MPRRVVVTCPGGERHLRDVASAFAEAGDLHSYISTAGMGATQISQLRRRLPRRLGDKLVIELKRREVTPEVAERAVLVGTAGEAANVILTRLGLPTPARLALYRPVRESFDRAAARRLTSDVDAVIGSQGTTTSIFRRAGELGIGKVLDYPIAHYAFTERTLQEEARLVPEYADTMLVTGYPDWVRRRYAEEIAAADRIIMVSEAHQRNFAEAGVDPERTFIVHWYVNTELFTPPVDEETDVFRVAFMGELSQRKGLSYLIDGFARAGLDDAELVLIGGARGSRPWAGRPGVRHVPPMANFLLPDVLRTCHAIALPSLVEGFPVSVLEAMACGLPAIISENIGDDIVEEGVDGFVVPIRDPDAIAERLRRLHADTTLRRSMARAARAKAETFTRERNHAEMRAGVEALLTSRDALAVPS
jgi:alpha-maltose-1-phosphate synthase